MNTVVSIFAEIPEELHDSLRGYLDKHPQWDLDRVFATALSLFLLQNESSTEDSPKTTEASARFYLETLYQQTEHF